jgi:hypothetical protein
MLEYIYFVKCPGCEDEHFHFFSEAKDFALSCLNQKPIITQIEVNRNDFGECTDSADLGIIWSWEDMMKDVTTEPEESVFTKADLKCTDCDAEFDALDNSLDDVPDSIRKPIPVDMTIHDLVEAMEENEDDVECTWCEDLFDKSECRYEVNLGWLCDRCQAAIMSRGEQLTFRENSYWDFLDENLQDSMTLADLVKDSINHLVNDLGKDSTAEDFADDVIGDLERNYHDVAPEDVAKYQEWCSEVACEVSRQLSKQEGLTEAFDRNAKVEFNYDGLKVTLQGPKRDVDDWDEVEDTVSYIYTKNKNDVATDIWENFIQEADAEDVEGGLEALEDDTAWNDFLAVHFDDLLDKYYDKLLAYYEEEAIEEYEETHSLSESKKAFLEELEEPNDYRERLVSCPECGVDQSFDHETGICINCGFNI